MNFIVKVMPEAELNIYSDFNHIFADAPQNAMTWIRGIYAAINSLESFPNRCAAAREHEHFPARHLRQLTYKSHRIIFEVDEANAIVRVVYVRHAKMQAIGEPETFGE